MTNLNPTEANTTTTGITKVGTVTRNPSQVADTEARVVTPKDIVEEINVFPSFTEFQARNAESFIRWPDTRW
jgi:hypothetical protein